MGYDLQTIKAIEQGLPVTTVAATFQKDPAVLIAHPGVAALPDLKNRPCSSARRARPRSGPG